MIHNDGNDYNLLVGPPTPAPAERAITGILDFGDMVETWTVGELAVAVAYAVFGQADPLAAAERVAAGYDAARPLSAPEIEVLWTLAALRLCTSVCLSAHRRTAEPDNAYLLVSEAPAWEALSRMRDVHPAIRALRAPERLRAGPLPADARDRGVARAGTGRRWRPSSPRTSRRPSSSTSRSQARSSGPRRRPSRPRR